MAKMSPRIAIDQNNVWYFRTNSPSKTFPMIFLPILSLGFKSVDSVICTKTYVFINRTVEEMNEEIIFMTYCFTFEYGAYFPDAQTTNTEVLSKTTLQEEHGNTTENQRHEIRNQESTCKDTTYKYSYNDINTY